MPAGSVRVWGGGRDTLWAQSEPLIVPEHGEVFDLLLTLPTLDDKDTSRLSVIDARGVPVPRAELWLGYRTTSDAGTQRSRTDDSGRATVRLNARVPHDVQAFDAAHVLRPARASQVAAGTLDLVLQMAEPRTLAIVVRAPDGTPIEAFVAGAKEVAKPEPASDTSLPFALKGWPQYWSASRETSHAGGRAELMLPLEPFRLSVESVGYAKAELGPFDPAAMQPLIEVQLVPAPDIRGVVKASGTPMRNARVTLHRENAQGVLWPVDGFAARYVLDDAARGITDANGEFQLALPASGAYWLRAELDGWAPVDSGPLTLDSAVGARDLELELVAGGTLEGRAIVAGGADAKAS